MRKRILMLPLIFAFIFGLSGCMLGFNVPTLKTNESKLGAPLSYIYKDGAYEALRAKLDLADKIVEEEVEDFQIVDDIILDLHKYMEEISTYRAIEELKSAINQNQVSDKNSMALGSHLSDLYTYYDDLCLRISKSKYKAIFYPNMTDEEIEALFVDTTPEEVYEINAQATSLLNEVRALDNKSLLKEAPSFYSRLVKMYNRKATLLGYSNYLDYAYDGLYLRSYMPADINTFEGNVKKYVVPELLEAHERNEGLLGRLGRTKYNKFVDLVNTQYVDDTTLLDSYARYVGGSYYMSYTGLFNKGYYYFSQEKNALDGAFTTYLEALDTPAVYFGPSYQNLMTVCHEFGHYFAFKESNGYDSSSMDLAETQSQGNELVFLQYLEQKSNLDKDVSEAFSEYNLFNYLKNIVLSILVNEFENRVYSGNITDPNMYDNIFIDVCKGYGGYDKLKEIYGFDILDYWKLVCLEHAGYYISYAMSLVPSLELYLIADDNLDLALNKLMSIISCVSNDEGYEVTLKNAGLISPFSEDAYKNFDDLITL